MWADGADWGARLGRRLWHHLLFQPSAAAPLLWRGIAINLAAELVIAAPMRRGADPRVRIALSTRVNTRMDQWQPMWSRESTTSPPRMESPQRTESPQRVESPHPMKSPQRM